MIVRRVPCGLVHPGGHSCAVMSTYRYDMTVTEYSEEASAYAGLMRRWDSMYYLMGYTYPDGAPKGMQRVGR